MSVISDLDKDKMKAVYYYNNFEALHHEQYYIDLTKKVLSFKSTIEDPSDSKKTIQNPEYEEAYVFARGLLKIRPNTAFENYVNEMEQKYLK